MFDLVDTAKKSVSSSMLGRAGEMLGEPPEAVRRGMDVAIPVALSGFIQRSSTSEGARDVFSMVKDLAPGGEAPDLNAASSPELAQMSNRGSALLSSLFGGRQNVAVDGMARTSGLRSDKAASLLGLVVPLVGGLLGRETARRNLDASGLANLLLSQKDLVSRALPAGIEESLGVTRGMGVREVSREMPTSRRLASESLRQRTGAGRWLPLAIGAALLLLALSWWGYHRRVREGVTYRHPTKTHRGYGGGGRMGQGGGGRSGMSQMYRCSNGPMVSVEPTAKDRVRISYEGTTYDLNRTPSTSGERFSNGPVVWSFTQNRGILSSGGSTLAKDCEPTR